MSKLVLGLFSDSKLAGDAIAQLKGQGYGDEISVVSKDGSDTTAHTIDEPVADGAATGAAVGGVMAGAAALLAGATSLVLPGVGLLVAGPLATALTSAAAGAATGGIVGTLVDAGIPDNTAQEYENRISAGETLVAVDTDETQHEEVATILNSCGADEVNVKKS
jgi:uncharacterized membrane protein